MTKKKKPRTRVKGVPSRHGESVQRRTRGRWKKWILIGLVVLLLIPAMQVAVVRFVNPPLTLPMLIDQGSAMFSSTPKPRLRYRWIALPQIPDLLALVGDAADGYPGIPGIGPRTAATLLN